jgi:HD-GYP domain-containing protein (c-di-GMP phosphodiesterase class II)
VEPHPAFSIVTSLNGKTFFPDRIEQIISFSEYLQKTEAELNDNFYLFFLTPAEYDEIEKAEVFHETEKNNLYILVYSPGELQNYSPKPFFASLPLNPVAEFHILCPNVIEQGLDFLELQKKLSQTEKNQRTASRKLRELNEIGKSLTGIAEPDVLMNLILKKSRELTSADAGSICVVKYDSNDNPFELHYSYFQNDTLRQNMKVDLIIPVSRKSISGYCALSGKTLNIKDVYEIDEESEYGFNRKIDESTGYRTKSMLVHPMLDTEGTVLGVVQLINKLPEELPDALRAAQNIDIIQNFTAEDVELIQSLGAQAAVCLKNSHLIADIQNLFEGFVNASVSAIETRDPTTSGHSQRVCEMALEMARLISISDSGPYRDVFFTERDMRELRYACLLHDFGKLNVPEDVLTKAKKLQPSEMKIIRQRFEFIIKDIQSKTMSKKLELVEKMGFNSAKTHFLVLEEEEQRAIEEIENVIYFLIKTNEPTIMEEGNFQFLIDIAQQEYLDPYKQPKPWLTKDEVESLSVRKGSLTPQERKIIETHVTHSFTFLSRIPWPSSLRFVPSIAYGHHELLSGEGYPNQLVDDEILLQSKIMAIADIYDALTASDRPYKKAIPVERATGILKSEAEKGHIDPWLTELFIEKKVWRTAENLSG